jgi:hypothetical protein
MPKIVQPLKYRPKRTVFGVVFHFALEYHQRAVQLQSQQVGTPLLFITLIGHLEVDYPHGKVAYLKLSFRVFMNFPKETLNGNILKVLLWVVFVIVPLLVSINENLFRIGRAIRPKLFHLFVYDVANQLGPLNSPSLKLP